MSRRIDARYDDPLDLIWLGCAESLGIVVRRSSEVYASFDGAGTLTLSTDEHFDADDSLAQLIFHELCHALVAGPRRMGVPDWGMENVDERDLLAEHACHRLQAALLDRHGLRALLAVTTDHRPYWDALPVDPLGPGGDPAIALAREAFERATEGPWGPALQRALQRTQDLAALMRTLPLPEDSLWRRTRPLHASGFPLAQEAGQTCGQCAWSFLDASISRCRQTRRGERKRGTRVGLGDQGCVRFEPKLEAETCGRCAACCREGFDRVELKRNDIVRKRHPELVSVDGFGAHLARPDGRCVALMRLPEGSQLCRIYSERPSACADFAVGGDACLEARRRVGLSA